MNKLPVDTLSVLVDENNIVQTIGTIYGWGEDLHKEEPNFDPNFYKNVVQFDERSGYGIANQQLYELTEVPEDITEPYYRWCYTEEKGFYKNPEYIEPNNEFGIDNDTYNQVIDNYTLELVESGVL